VDKNMIYLRVKYSVFQDQTNVLPRHQVHAIRSDGQMFVFWIFTDGTNSDAIKRDLWKILQDHLNDSPMSPSVDKEGAEWSNQVHPDAYKGLPGWEEVEVEL
jgi:hypothetical protein